MAVRFSLLFPDEGVREYSVWNPPYGVLTDEETEMEIQQTPESPFPATLSGLSFTSELDSRSENENFIVEWFRGKITADSPMIEMKGEHEGLSSRIYSMSRSDITKGGGPLTTFRFVGDGDPVEFPYMYYQYTTRKDDPDTHYLTIDYDAFEINALAFDPATGIIHADSAILIEDLYNVKTWTADIEVYGEGSATVSDEAMPYDVSARWKDANIVAEGDVGFPWPENWKIENVQIGLNPDKDGNDTFTLSAIESWRLLSVKIVDLAVEPKVSDMTVSRMVPEMNTGTMETCPYDCIVPNGENIQYSPMRTVIFFVFGEQVGSGEKTAYPISLHPYTNRMVDGNPAIIPTIPVALPYIFSGSIPTFYLDEPEQFIPKFATGGGSRELHKYYMACTTAFLGGAAMVAILAVTKNMPLPDSPEPSDLSDSLFPIVWEGPRYIPEYGRWFTQNFTIGENDLGGIDRLGSGEGLQDDAFALWWIRDCGNGNSVKTYICCFNDSGNFTHTCSAYLDEPNNPSDLGGLYSITFNGENPTTSTVMIDPGMGNLLSFLSELCKKFKSAETKKARAKIMAQYESAIKDVLFALSLQRPNIPKKIENWVVPEGEFDQFPVAHNKFDIMELANSRFYEQPGGEGYAFVPFFQEPIRPDDPFPGTLHRKWLSLYMSASDAAFAIFIVSYHKKTNQLVRNNTNKPDEPPQHGKHLLRNNTERDILEFLDGNTRTFGKDAIYRKG